MKISKKKYIFIACLLITLFISNEAVLASKLEKINVTYQNLPDSSISMNQKTPPIPGNSFTPSNDINLNINNENKLKIDVTDPVKQIDGQLFKSKDEMMSQYFQIQKKMDIDDIKVLWESTIDRNPVIKFALKKLAIPADQRRAHSSVMARTVSALISGVSILPGILGADSMTSSASSAAGSIAKRVITSKEMPKQLPLTDTELIHLAKLVEDLQDRMIKNYYEYKSDLEALKIARKEVLKQNIAYSIAIRASQPLSIITTKKMYDSALKDEMDLKQKVKVNRLELERLAGMDVLDNLKLGKIIISDLNEKKVNNLPPIANLRTLDYVDKSVKELSQDAGIELKEDKTNMLSDLNILWNAAVERNETIRFAILKLSNPDGTTEKTNTVKKILSPLTSVASLIGVGMDDTVTATSAVLSGSMLNSLLSSDISELNSHLSKVTDTDLVLLAQETDDMQQKLVTLYFDYMAALADLNFVEQTLKSRKEYSEYLQRKSPELKTVADVFYQESIADEYKTRQNLLSARVALEQFVGNDAVISVDKNLKQRLSMKP